MSSLHLIHEHQHQLNQAFPGLVAVLDEVAKGKTTREDFIRQILTTLKDTSSFKSGIEGLSPSLKRQILDFLDGKSASAIANDGSKHHPHPQKGKHVVEESQLYEGNGEHIKVPLPPSLFDQSS